MNIKRFFAVILLFALIFFGISAFANATNTVYTTEQLPVTRKYAEPVTAFGGRLELPVGGYYVYTMIDGKELGAKVSEAAYQRIKEEKKYTFRVCRSEVTQKAVKIYFSEEENFDQFKTKHKEAAATHWNWLSDLWTAYCAVLPF